MKVVATLLAILLGGSLLIPTFANAEESKTKIAENSSSAILIERDTGAVLFEKDSDKKLPPASMTKIMTMILIMEAIESGKINLDQKIRTSEYAASMGGSQIFLEAGEEMTANDMLKGIAIASGNDASVAMAEAISGSEEEFVNEMNEKASEMGLKHTHFVNPTGLPAKNHYSTANDMALMAKELLKYELITKYTGLYEDYLRQDSDKKFWLVNTNKLVKFYPGVDGLKTGFTREAKYCLTATAKRDDMRVVAVVMGAPTPKVRNAEISKLFDYAFSQYKTQKLFDRHHTVKKVEVNKGDRSLMNVITSERVSVLLKKGQENGDITTSIKMNDAVETPIKKGDEVGVLSVKIDGNVTATSPVLSSENINSASWWQLMKRTASQFAKTPSQNVR
ncbi:D-alanyl-D-alanine carboxypeptidase family protein [Alkalihalobacillus macyae]|uniref:D-alanyl-D-alanine carboxypeptidase family protein n=1 Tax=Guptibacillus hwajinpoensis TaxID=208199 RepID=UPI00273C1A3C|nr:D-alanyl-D-alanine carboxypeptidase family protein [Alkalihalobacillus macyae]MDP4552700.1 D-alanyl-D-alanine carboxypeptidase family protein [Alkalihalobacillus macyae]